MQRIEEDTGIYVRYRNKASTPADMMEAMEGISNRMSLDWQLQRIEPAVLAILQEAGAEVNRRKSNGNWRCVKNMPENAEPIVRDAEVALGWIDRLRKAIADGDIEFAALCGLQLGYLTEVMGVRPFESLVVLGQRVREGSRFGHEKQYGTPAEKRAARQQIVRRWGAVRKEHPEWSKSSIDEQVGLERGVCAKTVQRARLAEKIDRTVGPLS